MRILILSINYPPEEIGIAVYSGGLAQSLAAAGHEVAVVTAPPYYPQWKVPAAYRGWWRRTKEDGVDIMRCPIYVPAGPSGAKRIIHHASFALSALLPAMWRARAMKADVVFAVAPSLVAAPVGWLAARIAGAKAWLHVQDFEVEAAFATQLIAPDGRAARLARAFERRVVSLFDRVSSISVEMCRKFPALGVASENIYEFRNWADIGTIQPMQSPSPYRSEWGIETPHVALYSGNIANKQGIDILIDAAKALSHRTDLTFVICGEGPNRAALQEKARGLANMRFYDLQSKDRLNALMGLATIHLLPQQAGAADLVLPSKLTNMLASGRPVIATADIGSGLAREVEGCGIVTPPENAIALSSAIETLMDDPVQYRICAKAARVRAEAAWDRDQIIEGFVSRLRALV